MSSAPLAVERPRTPSAPLVWMFDGPFTRCMDDMEDTLRRAIVQVAIDVSVPALQARLAAGDSIQPAWNDFLQRVARRYGLPVPPRVRYLKTGGPLVAFVIAYRS